MIPRDIELNGAKPTFYEKMSLWVDKHRPSSLGKLDYHKEQADGLRGLVKIDASFALVITYGSGAGR